MQNPSQPARTPLPTSLPPLQGLDLHARYYSARTGGDFFDAILVGPYVLFLLTDIAGARDQAHTIAAETQDAFRLLAPSLFGSTNDNSTEHGVDDINMMDTLATLAHEVNLALINAAGAPRFAPTFLGCFNLPLGLLAYINSGGQPAIFRDGDGTRILGHVTMPLGLFTHLTFEPAIQAFEPGASLLLVTKGILEARRDRTQFGVERATRLVETFPSSSAPELCETTLEQAHEFRKPPWYSPERLPFFKPDRIEDLTAVALTRPSNPEP
jgi:serine phosphatase RsbU (regulator of sigma subunit)